MLTPVIPKSSAEALHQRIRTAILRGELAAGAQLREVSLAERFGVSRSPLREALSRLEDEGLVTKIAFTGTFVTKVDPITIREIADLRSLLEPHAVTLSLLTLKAEGAKRLRDCLSTLEAAAEERDLLDIVEAHLALHRLFYEASGNATLLESWTGWEAKLRLHFVADSAHIDSFERISVVHHQLIAAILTEPPARVAEVVRQHVLSLVVDTGSLGSR